MLKYVWIIYWFETCSHCSSIEHPVIENDPSKSARMKMIVVFVVSFKIKNDFEVSSQTFEQPLHMYILSYALRVEKIVRICFSWTAIQKWLTAESEIETNQNSWVQWKLWTHFPLVTIRLSINKKGVVFGSIHHLGFHSWNYCYEKPLTLLQLIQNKIVPLVVL